jgi:uncharacterized membrane protein
MTQTKANITAAFILVFGGIFAIAYKILGADFGSFLIWLGIFALFSLIGAPLAARIFESFPDGGWIFSKPIALLLAALPIWILSYLKIVPFKWLFLVIFVVIAAAISYLVGKPRKVLEFIKNDRSFILILSQEALFAAVLLIWTFARGLRPEIYGIEKFMDYGFVMSMLRADYLPPADMWLPEVPLTTIISGSTYMPLLSS